MKLKFKELISSMLFSLTLLIFLDICTTAIIPSLGFSDFRLPFHILIILFLGLYVETPYTAVLILILQLVHSVFTVEGWAYGTFAGVLLAIILGYLKDLVQFRSAFFTIFLTFILQYIWVFIVGSLIYFIKSFLVFLPETLVLALCSPFFFSLLQRIWKVQNEGGGANVNV